jgi:enoyl-CoA hydratase/carnithine racemase
MTTDTARIIAKREGAKGWLILDNPARLNALSLAMYESLGKRVGELGADPAIRVIIVAGAGERAFAAGADISEFDAKRATAADIARFDEISGAASLRLEECEKPTIAMIRGYCIGGGLDLALRCDFRIAAEGSTFGIPAARLGLAYGFEDVQRLVGITGPAYAREILYSGRRFTSAEAMQMGLVNRVVGEAGLAGEVAALADILAANAPLTIRAMKRCIAEAMKDPAERNLAAAREAVDTCFASADYVEGRQAFMAKRPPVFRGR